MTREQITELFFVKLLERIWRADEIRLRREGYFNLADWCREGGDATERGSNLLEALARQRLKEAMEKEHYRRTDAWYGRQPRGIPMKYEYTLREVQEVITRLNVRLRVVPPEIGFYRNWTVVLSGPAGTTAAQGEDLDEAFGRAVERLEQERAHARASR